jgi:hypothetical protein
MTLLIVAHGFTKTIDGRLMINPTLCTPKSRMGIANQASAIRPPPMNGWRKADAENGSSGRKE